MFLCQYFVKINRGVYGKNAIHYRISEVFFSLLPLDIFRGFHDYSMFKDEQSNAFHERSVCLS